MLDPQFNSILDVRSLAVARAGELVAAGASFRLERGGIAVLRGPNGSGKTSVLRALAGLLPTAAGAIVVCSDGAQATRAALRRVAVYCGHLDGLKPALSGGEQLRFWCAIYGKSRDCADEAARHFSLDDLLLDAQIRSWSAGQRRRLALSRLLIAAKPIWLLDEPTAGLDARSQERMQVLLTRHCDRGGIAVIATHERFERAAALELSIGARA